MVKRYVINIPNLKECQCCHETEFMLDTKPFKEAGVRASSRNESIVVLNGKEYYCERTYKWGGPGRIPGKVYVLISERGKELKEIYQSVTYSKLPELSEKKELDYEVGNEEGRRKFIEIADKYVQSLGFKGWKDFLEEFEKEDIRVMEKRWEKY